MALKARLRHHERKEASAKKNQRKDSTLKLEDGEVYIDGKISCAIPKIPCCRLGQSLPENLRDGVKLKCTNEKCIYTKKLVHYQCFEQLEHTLMALLGVQGRYLLGSARGWTENQKRHNLWEKKGMSLLQRQLRCHCGKGQVVRDSEAWMEREKLLEPEEEKPKKAQKKVKKLPTLNFNQKAPPGVDPKKIQELDYFSSAALESALEDKYGPPKVTPTRIRTVTVNSVSSSTTNCSNKPPHFPIGLAPIETKEKKDEPVKQPKILIPMPPIATKYGSSPKSSRPVNAAKTWESFRTKKGDSSYNTKTTNSAVSTPENERIFPKLSSETSQKSSSLRSHRSISNNNSIISTIHDGVESTQFLMPPTPLNRIIIPSPIKHAADMAEAAGSTMSLTFPDYRDFSSSSSESSVKQTCDVGTQTVTTLQDMLYAVSPTGKCIKFEGQVHSQRKAAMSLFDENDWSSQLLANATVTAFENLDEVKDRRLDSGFHTRPPTRSPPESSPSDSYSSTTMVNNYGFEKLICPPPGFDQFTYPDDTYVPEEEATDEEFDDAPNLGPLPMPNNDNHNVFSIWNGPSIGLGERLIEILKTGEYKKLGR